MNEIIIIGGRSNGKTFREVLESQPDYDRLEKLGLSIEDLQQFAVKIAAATANMDTVAEQFVRAGELIRSFGNDLNINLQKGKHHNINHPNPVYRQYKRK